MSQSDDSGSSDDSSSTYYTVFDGDLYPIYYGRPRLYNENGERMHFSRRLNLYVQPRSRRQPNPPLQQNVTAPPTFGGNNNFQEIVFNQSFAGPSQGRQPNLQNPHQFSTNQGFSPNVPIQANVGDNSHFQPNVMMPPPFGGGHHFPGSIPLQPNVWPNQGYQQNVPSMQNVATNQGSHPSVQTPWNFPPGLQFQQNMSGTQFQWTIPSQSIAGPTQRPPFLVPMSVNPEEGNVLVGYIPVVVNSRDFANRGGYSRGGSSSPYRGRGTPRFSSHPATNRTTENNDRSRNFHRGRAAPRVSTISTSNQSSPVHHLDLRRNEESVVEVVNDSEEVVETANNTPDTDKIADANCNVKPSEACLNQTETSPLTMDSSDSSAEPTNVDTQQTPSIPTCEKSLEVADSSVKSDVNTEVGLQKLSISDSTVQSANAPPSSYKTDQENCQQLPAATNVQPAEYGDKPTTSRRFVPRAAPKRVEKGRQQVEQGDRPQVPPQPPKTRVTPPKPHEFQPVPKNKSFDLSKASEKSKLAMETARKQAQLEARLSQNETACTVIAESSSDQPCSSSQQATSNDVKLSLKLSDFVTKAELNPPPAVPKVSKKKRRATKKKQEKADSDLADAAVFEEAARYNLAVSEEAEKAARNKLAASEEAERDRLAVAEEAARSNLEVKIREYLTYREKVSVEYLEVPPQTPEDVFEEALLREHFFGVPFQDEDIAKKNKHCDHFLAIFQNASPMIGEDVEGIRRFYQMMLTNDNKILVKDIITVFKCACKEYAANPLREYFSSYYYFVTHTSR